MAKPRSRQKPFPWPRAVSTAGEAPFSNLHKDTIWAGASRLELLVKPPLCVVSISLAHQGFQMQNKVLKAGRGHVRPSLEIRHPYNLVQYPSLGLQSLLI